MVTLDRSDVCGESLKFFKFKVIQGHVKNNGGKFSIKC